MKVTDSSSVQTAMAYNIENYPTVFSTINGSRLYGTETPDSDYDFIAACIEPPSDIIGFNRFEQYTWKKDNTEGTIYSLRKFVKLVVDGNPSMLCTIFSPNAYDPLGLTSQEFKSHMVVGISGRKFIGYATSQLHRLQTTTGMHTTRQHLVEKYGFDTKYASQIVRLCMQGIEYLSTGSIQLPVDSLTAKSIKLIRDGHYPKDEFMEIAQDCIKDLKKVADSISTDEKVDLDFFNDWLIAHYIEAWHNNRYYMTKTGRVITDTIIQAWADEAERGYDL